MKIVARVLAAALAIREARRALAPGGAARRPRPTAPAAGDRPTRAGEADRPAHRRWLERGLTVAAFLAVAALVGGAVSLAGLVPVAASSGHWAITEFFLKLTMRRSVATRSLGISAPGLDDRALVVRGAGHYDGGCRPCHGAPGWPMPTIPGGMTPAPPELGEVVRELDADELFYIVKHGVKMTGMPAWPALQRDDEVWAVVAFLLQLPGLDPDGYRKLVDPELDEPAGTAAAGGVRRLAADRCARCHGADGLGRVPGAFPVLAGQRSEYLLAALEAYARGERHSGTMEPVASSLRPAEARALAEHYAGLPGLAEAAPSSGAPPFEAGRVIVRRGVPERKVPSCQDCHGPEDRRRNPFYPLLGGQDRRYLELQLALFASDLRGGSPYARLMDEVAHQLTAEQIAAVAAFYSGEAEAPAPPPGLPKKGTHR